MNPTIKTLREELEKEREELSDKEAKRWTNPNYVVFAYDSFKSGYEAATARLLSVVEKCIEQRDDAIWNRFRSKPEYAKVFFSNELADIMDKELITTLADSKKESGDAK